MILMEISEINLIDCSDPVNAHLCLFFVSAKK